MAEQEIPVPLAGSEADRFTPLFCRELKLRAEPAATTDRLMRAWFQLAIACELTYF
jgi:hypothetical protein